MLARFSKVVLTNASHIFATMFSGNVSQTISQPYSHSDSGSSKRVELPMMLLIRCYCLRMARLLRRSALKCCTLTGVRWTSQLLVCYRSTSFCAKNMAVLSSSECNTFDPRKRGPRSTEDRCRCNRRSNRRRGWRRYTNRQQQEQRYPRCVLAAKAVQCGWSPGCQLQLRVECQEPGTNGYLGVVKNKLCVHGFHAVYQTDSQS